MHRLSRQGLAPVVGPLLVTLAAICALAGCGAPAPVSVPTSLARGAKLAAEVLPPPRGYAPEGATGSSGRLTPDAFTHVGGDGPAARAGFVAGYRQNYVDPATREGIAISLLEFSSPGKAAAYLKSTVPATLSGFGPVDRSFPRIRHAVAIDGTRPYAGEWAHGVVVTKGTHYISLVYFLSGPGQAPVEFPYWVQAQYERVH